MQAPRALRLREITCRFCHTPLIRGGEAMNPTSTGNGEVKVAAAGEVDVKACVQRWATKELRRLEKVAQLKDEWVGEQTQIAAHTARADQLKAELIGLIGEDAFAAIDE